MKGVATLLLVSATALLTACDATQWPMGGNGARPEVARAASPSPSSKAAASKPVPVAAPATSAPARTTSVTPSGPTSTLDGKSDLNLVGLDTTQARQLLGAPTEEEQRSPARVWRYRYPQCTLDVSFYPDVQTRVFRVLSYEVNGNDGTEQGKRNCSAELRTRTERTSR